MSGRMSAGFPVSSYGTELASHQYHPYDQQAESAAAMQLLRHSQWEYERVYSY